MKYCDDYAALLDLYVDGELEAGDMLRVQTHLDTCPGCRAYVDDALAIRASFPDAEDTPVPDGFTEAVMSAVRANPRRSKQRTPWLKTLVPLAACLAIVIVLRSAPSFLAQPKESAVLYAQDSVMETAVEESAAAADLFRQDAKNEAKAEAQAAPSAPAEDAAAGGTAKGRTESAMPEAELVMEDAAEAVETEASGSAVFAPEAPAVEIPAENAPVDFDDGAVYTVVLRLSAACAPLLADLTPVTETDAEFCYELTPAQYEALLPQLEGLVYTAEDGENPTTETILVLLQK